MITKREKLVEVLEEMGKKTTHELADLLFAENIRGNLDESSLRGLKCPIAQYLTNKIGAGVFVSLCTAHIENAPPQTSKVMLPDSVYQLRRELDRVTHQPVDGKEHFVRLWE